ncbi:hypothetical protein SacmaDRAFT_0244 [Saccharomonospora marina XMU15]|uniref:RHS repeat protein n=1 Tax=Saccharomonospora marina XMU15 TaxID=882083 RepID=H5X094_9PSEU|nr:hypothetical protein [Saccharomonospora marina]EHR48554.1 hypothetical protein SacmaDRAFT_0244 [Saccharomonospora marina XMU15]
MGEPPYSGPVAAPWTFQGDATIDADSSTFRGYATNVAAIGTNLQDDMMGPVMLVNGGGKDVSLSTGGFPEGSYCDQLNSRNASEIVAFIQDLRQNLTAIPSGAHILADLYENTDNASGATLDAVNWAFAMPGAEKPANLPQYLAEGKTIEQAMTENGAADINPNDDVLISTKSYGPVTIYEYRTASGGTRQVTHHPGGTTEVGYDKKGNTVYEVTTDLNGDSVTTSYNDEGEQVSTTTKESTEVTRGNTTHSQVTTTAVDANGNETTTTRHIVTTKHEDGTESREYYTVTEKQDENGKVTTERTDERYIPRQPPAVTTDDWMRQTDDALQRATMRTGL